MKNLMKNGLYRKWTEIDISVINFTD